jgi:hypothetical protein
MRYFQSSLYESMIFQFIDMKGMNVLQFVHINTPVSTKFMYDGTDQINIVWSSLAVYTRVDIPNLKRVTQ